MKPMLAVALALVALGLFAAMSPADATTCARRASNCRSLGGGGACFEPFRLAACRNTGTYTAPDGHTFEAKDK